MWKKFDSLLDTVCRISYCELIAQHTIGGKDGQAQQNIKDAGS